MIRLLKAFDLFPFVAPSIVLLPECARIARYAIYSVQQKELLMFRLKFSGFSLLELIIALSIVAILASISVPSYSSFVARSRRSDAMSALLQLQLAQQRWRATNRQYASDLNSLRWPDNRSPEGYYRMQIGRSDATNFLAMAVPQGTQQSDGCGVFAINSQGPVEEAPYADARCWNR